MSSLHTYIREGEHQTQDFKFRVDDAKKIARTIAAFANTDGGRLLIGVKDNGKVVGVNPEEEFHIIQGAAALYCKPEVTIKTNVLKDKHKLVLEVIVDKVENKPVMAKDEHDKWKVYIRRADHTLLANKILLGIWKRNKMNTAVPQTFDENEQLLLATIKEHKSMTISKLYRTVELKKSYIDKLLVLFVCWNILKMDITPTGTFFSIFGEGNDTE